MKKYYLAILAIFKNEEMIIQEWIEHHIWQGVNHFYLIDNGSTDNYLKVIQPYIDKGIITLFLIPEQNKQVEHYNTVFNKIKDEMEWIMVIDIDEYMYGTKNNLVNTLKIQQQQYNCFVSYWLTFGSNGYDKQPKSIRESFLTRMDKIEDKRRSKCIIKADIVSLLDVHVHRYQATTRKVPLFGSDDFALNHYQIMSKEYFEKIKMNNGDVYSVDKNNIRDWKYFKYRDDLSTIEDLTLSNLIKNNYRL